MIDPGSENPAHSFEHEAMNTVFTLRIPRTDTVSSLRAAGACFRLLDHLESCLSRYREESDVSRVNAMQTGDSLFIEEETHSCLKLAVAAAAATGGLFDATLGMAIEHRKTGSRGKPPPLRGQISLAPDRPMVFCAEAGRQIDLGGIGKGFALDRMAAVLREHGIESALLSCAGSTLLAMGAGRWPVVLRGDKDRLGIELSGEALSASGTAFQENHVVHPETDAFTGALRRVWTVAREAAWADALSTACLLMDGKTLAEFQSTCPELKRCWVETTANGRIDGPLPD